MENLLVISKRSSLLILIFAVLGAFAAGFSLYEHTLLHIGAMTGPSVCNIGGQFNCDIINKSRYSTVFGVPLAAIGLGYYLVAAAGALVSFFSGLSLASLGVLLIASFVSVALSLYLFFISKMVIGYLCLFCMVMYLSNFGTFYTSVRASRGSIGQILHQGLFAPGEFLMNLITGSKKIYAWSFLFLSAASIYGVYEFPSWISKPNLQKLNAQNSAYFSLWKREPPLSVPIQKGGPLDGDYTAGTPGASIEIVEYSDFECPACRMFYPKVEKYLKDYGVRLSFTPKNFPLDTSCNRILQRPIHQHSCEIASFVRCSGEQGKFWEAYHQAFTDPTIDKGREGDDVLPSLLRWATGAGLDAEAIQSCINSGRQLGKIKAEVEEGISFNIQSTPTIYIDGRKTNPQQFEEVLNSLLSSR